MTISSNLKYKRGFRQTHSAENNTTLAEPLSVAFVADVTNQRPLSVVFVCG